MASGNSLLQWTALSAEFPASNYATLDTRNNHPCLDFDQTTGETCYFSGVMPQHYSDTTGVTVYLHWTGSVNGTNTVGWRVAFERMADGGSDISADSFTGGDQTVTAEAADATNGILDVSSVAVTKGANMDSVVAGDLFRLRITRDVANDTLAGDAELYAVEVRES